MKFWAFIMGGFTAVDVVTGVAGAVRGDWLETVVSSALAILTGAMCVYYVRQAWKARAAK